MDNLNNKARGNLRKMRHFPLYLKYLNIRWVARMFLARTYSINRMFYLGIKLDKIKFQAVPTVPEGTFRRFNEGDIEHILGRIKKYKQNEIKDILSRIVFFRKGFKNAYVYVMNDKIAGIQWLITPEENDILKAYYGSKYIKLQNSQVKVENIYVFPEFRGRGFANFLIVRLLTMAREMGYNYCICQIEARNTISLNEHIIIGFKFLKYIENNKVLGFGWSSR